MHLRDKKSKVVAIDSQKIKRAAELMGLLEKNPTASIPDDFKETEERTLEEE